MGKRLNTANKAVSIYRKIVSLKALHESDELNQEIQSMDSDFRQQKQ